MNELTLRSQSKKFVAKQSQVSEYIERVETICAKNGLRFSEANAEFTHIPSPQIVSKSNSTNRGLGFSHPTFNPVKR